MSRKPDDGKSGKVTKAFAYRDAAAKFGAKADIDKVQKHILDNFGIDMTKTQISQYRSNEKLSKKKRGKKLKTANAEVVVPSTSAAKKSGTILDFIRTVRSWEHKIGPDEICKIIDALYETK